MVIALAGFACGQDQRLNGPSAATLATGRAADENEMDALIARAFAQTGRFRLWVDCLTGTVTGKYRCTTNKAA